MKKLTTRLGRGAAALVGASLIAAATAMPAGAVTNVPDRDSTVAGPNCPGNNFFWNGGIWPSYGGGNYTGYQVYNNRQAGWCDSTSEYVWTDQSYADDTFMWTTGSLSGDGSVAGRDCYVWVYVPSEDAGAPHARYDVWATDDYGLSEVNPPEGWHWLFWPGHTIDQNSTSGWVYIGQAQMGDYPDIVVTMTNQDTAGWEIGAGSVAFHCV
jgi:hypothetical protein